MTMHGAVVVSRERMNSPLETREVRLRGLWGWPRRVPAVSALAADSKNRLLWGEGR